MYIVYPEKIVNNKILTAEQLNNNFGMIGYVLNGNVSGENFDEEAEITVNTITTQKQKIQAVKVGNVIDITFPDSDGTSYIRFYDKNNQTIMKIYSDGKVEI